MQAVILAGGKGTRLRSLTKDAFPKPLISFGEITLLDYLITHLQKNGCTEIILCTGYQGEKIRSYIAKKDYDIPILISHERKPLGTAGACHLIADALQNEFVVLYGDVFTTIDIKKMYRFHQEKKADVTLAVHMSDHPYDSTIVSIDESDQVRQFIEKPGDSWKQFGNLTTTPLYIVRKDVLHFIPQGKEVDFAKDIFPAMLKEKKKLFGYHTEEYAKDIGTPERYHKVLRLLNI